MIAVDGESFIPNLNHVGNICSFISTVLTWELSRKHKMCQLHDRMLEIKIPITLKLLLKLFQRVVNY